MDECWECGEPARWWDQDYDQRVCTEHLELLTRRKRIVRLAAVESREQRRRGDDGEVITRVEVSDG